MIQHGGNNVYNSIFYYNNIYNLNILAHKTYSENKMISIDVFKIREDNTLNLISTFNKLALNNEPYNFIVMNDINFII